MKLFKVISFLVLSNTFIQVMPQTGLSEVAATVANQGTGWMQWLDAKTTFTVTLKPISSLCAISKSIWNGQGWSVAALVGVCFGGYYLNKKYKCWWNCQCDARRYVNTYITDDLGDATQSNENLVLECANKCQTLYFTKDQQLINLVTNFYTFRKAGDNKYKKKAELKSKASVIFDHIWGKFKTC